MTINFDRNYLSVFQFSRKERQFREGLREKIMKIIADFRGSNVWRFSQTFKAKEIFRKNEFFKFSLDSTNSDGCGLGWDYWGLSGSR
jgi:hypothetical protein